MKLKLSILLFFTAVSFSQAQSGQFRFGLKASPSVAWLKTDTKGLESNGSKLTFSWGFMGEYFFADNYAFAFGVDLGSKGGKLDVPAASFDGATNTVINYTIKEDLKLRYIDVPLTIKMRTNEIGYMRYFGQFGFVPGINLSSKADMESKIPGIATSTKNDEDIKKYIVPINVGLLIALGAEYSLSGNTALVVSVAFNNGFIDVADFDIYDTETGNKKGAKMMANTVALNVGVLF